MSRTEEKNCSGCRYWSEMVARAGGGADNVAGDTEALCLNAESPFRNKYKTGRATCAFWKLNTLGAVDDPPDYGEATRAAYAESDKIDRTISLGIEKITLHAAFIERVAALKTPTDDIADQAMCDAAMANLDDETLCSDVTAFYELIREARKLID